MTQAADVPVTSAGDAYHRWYYNARVWERIKFLGVECLKSISDLWNYQEIIYEMHPTLVVEFGTWTGGATLFFSTLLQIVNSKSKVLSVDINTDRLNPSVRANPHVEILTSSSTSSIVAERIASLRSEFPGRVFAILDSDHRKEHVLAEMKMLRDLLKSGDYLVVEDSNINGHPVLPGWGDGPLEAILEYEREFPNDYLHDVAREEKFGFTFAPHGYLIRR